MKTDIFKASISFVVLFVLYHSAEYAILFMNNALLFFIFQFLFFLSAWFLGNWHNNNEGINHWGLVIKQLRLRHFLIGVASGVALYAIPYLVSLTLEIETIKCIPSWFDLLKSSIPFSFGILFTSFSEDILTRGTVFSLFRTRLKAHYMIIISASLYLFNHIYRLQEGFETWSYIFLLGVLFMIPVILTQNLWITGFMHWTGNTFFYVTHSVIQTDSHSGSLTPNQLFSIWIVLLIPLTYYLGKKHQSKLMTKSI